MAQRGRRMDMVSRRLWAFRAKWVQLAVRVKVHLQCVCISNDTSMSNLSIRHPYKSAVRFNDFTKHNETGACSAAT